MLPLASGFTEVVPAAHLAAFPGVVPWFAAGGAFLLTSVARFPVYKLLQF
jgi:hypothetical protein